MSDDSAPDPALNGIKYSDAGVDITAGEELVRRIAPLAARTRRPEILGGVGGFAALARLPDNYRQPVLVTSTDGVGTKLVLAGKYDCHRQVGQDLVAMCVNDCLVCGAEPLLFLDYYASGHLQVEQAARVMHGIADGCALAGCTLAGGETAEMPGLYAAGDYDLAGFCVAVAEQDALIDGSELADGDALIALASSGMHANGFSLLRHVLAERQLDPALIEQLMLPTRIYVPAILDLLRAGVAIKGMAHITGGGLPGNLPRMAAHLASEGLGFALNPDSWQLPEVFRLLADAGPIAPGELLRTFNCGIGFVLCVAKERSDATLQRLHAAGETAWEMGHVTNAGMSSASDQIYISATGDLHITGNWPDP